MIIHGRYSCGFVWSLVLLALLPGRAAAQTPQEVTGIVTDPSRAIDAGWLVSTRTADFPLEEEAKIRTVLAGLVAPNSGARIFVLYSVPKSSLPLTSISYEPTSALLEFLDVDSGKASGRYEADFLAPGIDAIHWFLRGQGDGITFRPSASARLQETYGIRTILSFGVLGPDGVARRVLLSAFLRCKARDAERFTPVFWDFLKTIRPVQSGARLVPADEFSLDRDAGNLEVHTKVVFQESVRDFSVLAGRHLSSLASGEQVALHSDETEILDRYLKLFPADILAVRLKATGKAPQPLSTVDGPDRDAYVQHLAEILKLLSGQSGFESERRQYSQRLGEVEPGHPLLAAMTSSCRAGTSWVDESNNREYRCRQVGVSVAGSPISAFASLPAHPRHGETVEVQGTAFSWHADFGSWLPVESEPGETVETESVGRLFRLAGAEDLAVWARLETVDPDKLRRLRRSRGTDVCPSGFALLSPDIVDWTGPSSDEMHLALLRTGTDGLLLRRGPSVVMAELARPEEATPLSDVRLKKWKGRKVTAFCTALLQN